MKRVSLLFESDFVSRLFIGRTKKILFLSVIVFLTFLILDLQAVKVGDDLGYMFSDRSLHSADGKRVESFGDILSTQMMHYRTCNGRFLVHYIVQLMVSMLPGWVGSLLNSLMFTLLWLLTVLCAFGRRHLTVAGGVSVLVLLWIGLPVPGVTMLSLDAFAVNYLWVSVFILMFMVQWGFLISNRVRPLPNLSTDKKIFLELAVLLFAVIVGSLQESFSIPLIGGMLITMIIYHKTIHPETHLMFGGFSLGTLVLILSPGNWGRTDFNEASLGDVLLHRLKAMGLELMHTAVVILAVVIVVALIVGKIRRRNLISFGCRDNFVYITLVFALLLDSVTFTGVRQLFFPSLLSIIMICRVGSRLLGNDFNAKRYLLEGMIICGVVFFSGAYLVRYETKKRMIKVEQEVKKGKEIIEIDCTEALYNYPEVFRLLFSRYDDDPFEGKYLQLMFDRFTKQGLTRIFNGKTGDVTVLPCSVERLVECGKECEWSGNEVKAGVIDRRYGVFVPSKGKWEPGVGRRKGKSVPFERVIISDSLYYIVPFQGNIEEPFVMKRVEQSETSEC